MKLTDRIFVLFAVLLLAGCGIKPGDVAPPDRVKQDQFPHTYPNPGTIDD
jgi:hypothetical protein